jgi:RimJ/RimL family protein N-acetyltransferase
VIVLEQLPSIRQWAECRLQCDFGECRTIANYRGGELVGVIIFNNFKVSSAEFSVILKNEYGYSREFLRVAANYIFNIERKWRLTAFVNPLNTKAKALIEKAGFIYEGTQREAADGGGDLLMFGLLKSECKWVD